MGPPLADQTILTSAEEFAARKLRTVGVVGLYGVESRCAFKEHLESATVVAIHTSFLKYLRALFGASFGELSRNSEIHELERLMSLPDLRAN